MASIENLILTGSVSAWGILFIKSLFTTEIEKKFMPRWQFIITEGILVLFFSFVLGMLTNIFIINLDVNMSELWITIGDCLLFIINLDVNMSELWITIGDCLLFIIKCTFIITFFWITFILLKTKNLSKKLNEIHVIMTVVFLVSGIVVLSSSLFLEVPYSDLKEDFLGYSIIMGLFYFLMFAFSIQGINKSKPGYKMEVYFEKDNNLNGLYFEQAIDKNRHIYLRDFRGKDKFEVFYLYYLSEGKIYKYEREEFYK